MLKSALLVRPSGLLPRKPMRVTLFWYMIVSPFVEFRPLLLGSHWAELSEWARLPSAEGLLSGRGPKEVCTAFFDVILKVVLGGTETPKGRAMRSRRPTPAASTTITETGSAAGFCPVFRLADYESIERPMILAKNSWRDGVIGKQPFWVRLT